MFNPASVRDDFDTTPFGFSHTLHTLDLFSPQALAALAGRYAGHPDDYFVAASAASPGTRFYDVPRGKLPPHEAIARLEHGAWRVLLKRLESHDSGFADLLQALFGEVTAARDDLRDARIVRLESAVFISSAASTTPFHFDPEINHFCQIAGAKTYHVYPPSVLAEHELERFYIKGEVNIGQVDLAGRDPAREHVFQLAPGLGLHQPQHAPHWVETGSARSVSYSFVFETDAARARGRARSANHYLRMLGMRPRLGASAAADRAKARVMAAVLPVRRGVRRALRG
jgi:hypothetical protein